MQLLITGGAGSLSKLLVLRIVDHGHRVFLLGATEFNHPRVQCFTDLGDTRFDFRTLDAILDLAGPAPDDEVTHADTLRYLDLTRSLLARARRAGVPKIVHVSSYRVPGRSHPFVTLKNEQEELIKRSGIPYLIFRSPWIVGPADRFLAPLVRVVSEGTPLWLDQLDHIPIPMVTQQELAHALIEALHVRLNVSRVYEIASFPHVELAAIIHDIGFQLGRQAGTTANPEQGQPLPWHPPAISLVRARMAGATTAYYLDFNRAATSWDKTVLEVVRQGLQFSGIHYSRS